MIKHENSTSEKKIAADKPPPESRKKRSILLCNIMAPAKVFTMDSAPTIILSKQILLFAKQNDATGSMRDKNTEELCLTFRL